MGETQQQCQIKIPPTTLQPEPNVMESVTVDSELTGRHSVLQTTAEHNNPPHEKFPAKPLIHRSGENLSILQSFEQRTLHIPRRGLLFVTVGHLLILDVNLLVMHYILHMPSLNSTCFDLQVVVHIKASDIMHFKVSLLQKIHPYHFLCCQNYKVRI